MFILADRVKESSLTEGNVDHIVLNDTFGGFVSFADAIGSGNSNSGNAGNSGGHSHSASVSASANWSANLDMRVQYINVIYCTFS